MDRFITDARRWREPSRLHVYLLPDLDQDASLAALVDRAGVVLAEYRDVIAAVPAQWLHITVQPVVGRPASAVSPHERALLVDRLTQALADVPPARLIVGSVLATASSVMCDVDGDLPGEPMHTIHTRVQAAISDVLGPDAVAKTLGPPHLTLGYATATGDSGIVQSRLRYQVRPSHARMAVRAVHLVDVVQDAEQSQYRWTSIAQVPLAGEEEATVSAFPDAASMSHPIPGQRASHWERR